jgi:LmbE family N-acetylglucosaminyl deacetylase
MNRLRARIDRVVEEGKSLLVLSPHLDDGVLSCGGLLHTLAGKARTTVLTIFTEASPPPHPRAARSFLQQCAATDTAELYAQRRQEDADVLAGLEAKAVHLGMTDALFRRRETGTVLAQPVLAGLGRAVPEVLHRYPTYRLDIAQGRVSRGDRTLIDRLDARIRALAGADDVGLVFAPIGVGRHVDHLITRTLGARHHGRVVHYSDFPYDRVHPVDTRYVRMHRLRPETWTDGVDRKPDLVRGYRTQAAALFPDGAVPVLPETYYLAE